MVGEGGEGLNAFEIVADVKGGWDALRMMLKVGDGWNAFEMIAEGGVWFKYI